MKKKSQESGKNLAKILKKTSSNSSGKIAGKKTAGKTNRKILSKDSPKIVIAMGSQSDYETMRHCEEVLKYFEVSYEVKIISAHRTPQRLFEFASRAQAQGLQIIIAGAGGAAHLPGMIASLTQLPVLGVPVESKILRGYDSLLSIVQMPAGIPVGSLAIGESGAKNAALLAISILALNDEVLSQKLAVYRQKQTESVALQPK